MKGVTRIFTALLCLAALTATAEQPEPFTYSQAITVQFHSEADAESATLAALELPAGKTLAVSSRWDDTNWAHLDMARTLAENGWFGSFLINRFDANFAQNVMPRLLEAGCDIGVHTTTHPHLETLTPNAVFREIMENRVNLEIASGSCVTAFTFPYGLRETTDPDTLATAADQGQVLLRSGLLGGGEHVGIAKVMGLEPGQFISSNLCRANDRDPNLAEFTRTWEHAESVARRGAGSACGPLVALGVHSWQKSVHPDGFERLSMIIATKSNVPEFWYCNQQDYMAYRLGFLNFRAEKTAQTGAEAQFALTRVEPFELGAALGQWVRITPAPKSVRLGDVELPVSEDGLCEIPHAQDHAVPTRFDMAVSEGDAGTDAESVLVSSRFDAARNRMSIQVQNVGKTDITELHLTLRVPLRWKLGVYRRSVTKLRPGEGAGFDVGLELARDGKYASGGYYLVGQLDLREGDVQRRIYCVAE